MVRQQPTPTLPPELVAFLDRDPVLDGVRAHLALLCAQRWSECQIPPCFELAGLAGVARAGPAGGR